jgi:ATP-dependent DNA helicase Rep
MSRLNPDQQRAARHVATPLLVLAGAGSGKTRVIIHKIEHLIREQHVSAEQLVAITFTNKAAREMKQRLQAALGKDTAQTVHISTFHALGMRILRRDYKSLDYRSGFTLFSPDDSAALVKELHLKHVGPDLSQTESMRHMLSRWKNALVDPLVAMQQADNPLAMGAAKIYGEYEHYLHACNAFDLDDLIYKPTLLFRHNPEILARWQDDIRYVLVDEYQDTNHSQYELIRLLCQQHGGLTVVGDDDQSIYAWRGAAPENMQQLQLDFPALEVIKLEQNYRSSGNILKAANQLIANNSHLYDKQLWSSLGPGDSLRVLACRNTEHEAERVVSDILHRHFQKQGNYRDFAILYRGNHQARIFEEALREHQLPYRISGGRSFFDCTEVKDVLAYLRLIINPDDNSAFLRIINTPRREIGAGTLDKITRHASTIGSSLLAACLDTELLQAIGTRGGKKLHEFAAWMERMQKLADSETPDKVLHSLLSDIDYHDWLTTISKDTAEADRRRDNLQSLVDWIERMSRLKQSSDLNDHVTNIILQGILDNQDNDQDANAVSLMTLHAAKGLEFDHVYLVGMEEDLLPHRNSLAAGDIEEERRLAYVGITRAKRTLSMCYAMKRKRQGEMLDCEPSRFLNELPSDILDWDSGKVACEEQRQSRGEAYLSSLRDMLS